MTTKSQIKIFLGKNAPVFSEKRKFANKITIEDSEEK